MYLSLLVIDVRKLNRWPFHERILNEDVGGNLEGISNTGEIGDLHSLGLPRIWLPFVFSLRINVALAKGVAGGGKDWKSDGILSKVRGSAVGIMRDMRAEQLMLRIKI